ncbi:PHD finger domain protein [Talaromyces stipitatus ATCC 10500]|uniref:PHD finger domain protein n=1 Tax=Talaromyces stipitatus (strain ATCC 10500 / CBS 375.48 / QM 6759 / NRRL 1006) TaxID=441959 RepID=B8M3G0_TALSN|nr:PHD finger domain protein [Talaromyces stipitatus ATCC 10500]EED22332.1 PHD finger domain protein [Talaromyces stipitatus ATCC 10500]
MSWDRPVHSFSYSNGEPQTPTRTPTSAAFAESSFQTPKFESSFYDPRVTWDTADPYASSPELLKTPQRFVFGTPSNGLQQHRQQDLDASFGQHPSPNATLKGPANTDTVKRRPSTKPTAASVFGEEGPGTINSVRSAATIQTPPPTRTSNRKTLHSDEQGYFGSSRKLSEVTQTQLETPSRIIASSPHLFANFQNSPDFFQFSNIDATSSPFFPQQKLFLDQDVGNVPLQVSNDPFADTRPSFMTTSAVSQVQALEVPPLPTIQGSLDLPDFGTDMSFGMGSTAPADAALFPTPFSASPRVPITKTEDPSLFLSSPARRFGPPQPMPQPMSASRPTKRQPYHHQTEEAKREQLRRTTSRSARQPLAGAFSDDEVNDEDEGFTPRAAPTLRPGLARSKTTTAISATQQSRQQSQQSSSSLASTSGIKKTPSKGRSSPVKAMRPSLPRASSACVPTRSQSLILKIDKDGRAKTELQDAPGKVVSSGFTGLTDPISEMDIDGSITESETDSAEFSDSSAFHSTHHSFAFPASTLTKPKVSRTGSISRPNSKSSFASTISSSSASGRRSPWAESRPIRPQSAIVSSDWINTPQRFATITNASFTRQSSSTDSTLPDPDEDTGDAQHALRQVLKGRGRNTIGRAPGSNVMKARMSGSQTMHNLRSSPPGIHSVFDLGSGDPTTSPTTLTDPDLATPGSDRHSNPSSGTRCVCKSLDNGGHLMIQCHWLHTKCVGLDRANLPPVYICVYCSSTPMRGGRLRDPLAAMSQTASSPLARKSFRYR